MEINKLFNIKTVAAGLLVAGTVPFIEVEQVPAPTLPQCNKNFKVAESDFRMKYGFNLTDGQRREFLRIMGARSVCAEKARDRRPEWNITWQMKLGQ